MDKKKFTSWGVGFTSLALVAGMVSYLGFTNKDTTSKTVAQSQVITQSSTQQSQSGNNQSSSLTYELPNQTTSNSGSQQSISQSSSSRQGNFDTTTGGS